jgi:conjugative relaxase-like TrwC/TraI family protein
MGPERQARLTKILKDAFDDKPCCELDPQLHAHAVAANPTFDATEGRWKALQASDIYECRAYLSEVYRNALGREVRALGYEIGGPFRRADFPPRITPMLERLRKARPLLTIIDTVAS